MQTASQNNVLNVLNEAAGGILCHRRRNYEPIFAAGRLVHHYNNGVTSYTTLAKGEGISRIDVDSPQGKFSIDYAAVSDAVVFEFAGTRFLLTRREEGASPTTESGQNVRALTLGVLNGKLIIF